MTTILAAMTDPEYAGMVIIIAGYPRDMDQMLNRNVGLKSRFTKNFDFKDWEAKHCADFFLAHAEKENWEMPSDVRDMLESNFESIRALAGWANGRDVLRIWKDTLEYRANRVIAAPEDVKSITEDEIQFACDAMLTDRSIPEFGPDAKLDMYYQSRLAGCAVDTQSQDIPKMEELVEEAASALEPSDSNACEEKSIRDPGVSDALWEELEKAKAEHQEQLEREKREREEVARIADLKERERKMNELLKRIEEERRKAVQLQERIRQICPCPAGFQWFKCGAGWRCGGGSHFVSNEQLNRQFTC